MKPSCAPLLRPMISDRRRESLSSMYSLVGSHSAVKLCRWQKSMMRGRGGCYKWTMYGIRSHQCMESTPNIACANKCIFCWRLNTNPTATEWKWDVDDPVATVEALLSKHKEMVGGVQGMPGVTETSLAEALTPRHCALSLVGEPIMYPRINEFLCELHRKGISTFLVNNGQFPDAIEAVTPITQLYLSVDAPNREIMKRLDRPVFPDFWDRFNQSVHNMSKKPYRTVFRLTMIEDVNMGEEHIKEFVDIFQRGRPHFIELKRLTPAFSGNTDTFLRIRNVPSWRRLREFSEALAAAIGDGSEYRLACVHEHSGCILLGRKDFFIDGKWHTWIDFDKFQSLFAPFDAEAKRKLRAGGDTGAGTPDLSVTDCAVPFTAHDYTIATPDWALHDSPGEGFDPDQRRHITTKRRKHMEQQGQLLPVAEADGAEEGEGEGGEARLGVIHTEIKRGRVSGSHERGAPDQSGVVVS